MRVSLGVLALALVPACEPVREPAGQQVDLVAHRVSDSDYSRHASLRVAFLPTPENCSPQDLIAARALSRLDQERDDVAVLTFTPSGLPPESGMGGLPFPGRVVDLPLYVLEQSRTKVARPRFEVYGPQGQLLLLRPVYPYEEQRLLHEEILSLLRYVEESAR